MRQTAEPLRNFQATLKQPERPRPVKINLLRSILPDWLLRKVRLMRILDPPQRRVHFSLVIRRKLGLRRDSLPRPRREISRILFVCYGNIIRSPYGAALLSQKVIESGSKRELEITSAGLLPRSGRPADARAVQVAARKGIVLSAHRSRSLTPEMVRRADLIIIMDAVNEAILLSRYPGSERKVVLLGAFGRGPGHRSADIEDPFTGNTETVQNCFERIDRSVDALWRALESE